MKSLKKKGIRTWVQLFFFLLIALIATNNQLVENGGGTQLLSSASLHALCPFGGVVTLYQLVSAGLLVQKIHMSSVVLMGILFFLAVLLGPVFCGWVCPLGSIQEWIGSLGRKLFKKRYNQMIPRRIDKYAGYFRYLVLVWVVVMTARSAQLLFEHVDPYNALFTFWTKEAALPSLILLGLTLTGSVFVERPWCKYLCPYGALLGLFNKIRLFKIVRQPETCIHCGKCDRACPMNIPVSDRGPVRDVRCISCMKCTSSEGCPVANTVGMKIGENSAKGVSQRSIAILTMVLIFGGIALAGFLGIWTTSADRNITKTDITVSDGNSTALSVIKGSTTLQEAADAFGIDSSILTSAFSVTEEDGGARLKTKDLDALFPEVEEEIGRESVQLFIALYLDIPFDAEGIYLPEQAKAVLENIKEKKQP